jgi:hypothetical protein
MIALSLGILMTITSWIVAWSRIPILSEYAFFPLWLGYVLTVNGMSAVLFKDSLLLRMRWSFLLLFLLSVPFWWYFKMANLLVHNWHYEFYKPVSSVQFAIEESIDFSTVLPAALSTIFLSYRLLEFARIKLSSPPIPMSRRLLVLSVLAGGLFVMISALIPTVAFPLVWIAPILLLEPIMFAVGYPCVLRRIERGEWLFPAAIAIGALFNGVWSELWNFYSLPKWVYTVPYVGLWKVFEMPLLGYFAYPFFGFVVYSYTEFAMSGLLVREPLHELIASVRKSSRGEAVRINFPRQRTR